MFDPIICKHCGNVLNFTICIDCEVVTPYCDECGYAGYHTDDCRLLVHEENKLNEVK